MKKSAVTLLSMVNLALFALGIGGCEKFHDNFPSGPSIVEPPVDPTPSSVVGSWINRDSVVDDQHVRVYTGAVRLQFSSDGEFSELGLSPDGVTLWHDQGTTVFQGQLLSLVYSGDSFPDGNVFRYSWSLDGNKLALTGLPIGGPPSSDSTIYIKE